MENWNPWQSQLQFLGHWNEQWISMDGSISNGQGMENEWKKSTQPKLAIYRTIYNLAILVILSQTRGTRYPKKIVYVHPETREFFAASQPHHGVWIRSFGVKSTISDMIIIYIYIYTCIYIYIYIHVYIYMYMYIYI